MTEWDTVADLRFEGMEVPELCRWIDEIKAGPGPEAMQNAARVVDECVQVVVELDETLRRELGKLHVEWEGQAARLASAANQHQADVLRESEESLKTSASGVRAQGDGFSQVRHGLPEPAELRPAQGASLAEWSGGPFGYEQDYDTEAKQLDGQKKAVQAALNAYRDNTLSQAESYQRLPEMRPASVAAQSGGGDGGANTGADQFASERFAGALDPAGQAGFGVDRAVGLTVGGAALAGVGAGLAGTLLGGEVGPEASACGPANGTATARAAANGSDDDPEHTDEYAVDEAWLADDQPAAPTPPDVSQTDIGCPVPDMGHGVDAGSRYDVGHQANPDDGKQC